MKKVIYVLILFDHSIGFDEGCENYEVLSAYDSVEEAEKGMLNYYNNYIAPDSNTPIANTIEEMETCLDEINYWYEINDVHYYTK
jgi:hypothetical protein